MDTPHSSKKYKSKSKEYTSEYSKKYYQKKKEAILKRTLKYYHDNKEKALKRQRIYRTRKYKEIPEYKLRVLVSRAVSYGLHKNGQSVTKYLSYTFHELKEHLEKQFEIWMNWDNHGIFNPNLWMDNDEKSWTWQLDHIIPQSELPYTSMEDDNFKKCWSLENLRPLSAKQNHNDGVNRLRHKKDI